MNTRDRELLADSEVIRRVCEGEIHLFEVLLEKYEGVVLTIAKRHVPRDEVEEIAQEIFVRAFKSLPRIKKKDSFRAWLSTLAVRTCCDFWRKRYRTKEISFSSLSENQQVQLDQALSDHTHDSLNSVDGQEEIEELIDSVLKRLSAAERMVVELVYFEGMTMKEAARLTGWSLAGVKVRAFRARKKLEKLISERMTP